MTTIFRVHVNAATRPNHHERPFDLITKERLNRRSKEVLKSAGHWPLLLPTMLRMLGSALSLPSLTLERYRELSENLEDFLAELSALALARLRLRLEA